MARKERKKEQKKPKSKIEKRPAIAKKRAVTKAETVEKAESKPAVVIPVAPPVVDLLSSARIGICLFNADDSVAYCNQHFLELTDAQLEKMAGKKLRKNMLWGVKGQKDEFQELFAEAKESGNPLTRDRLPVGTETEDQRYWNLTLLPQYEDNTGYIGMYLVIEDVSGERPRTSIVELINSLHGAALRHDEAQSLLEDLAGILKDFCNCFYVKIAILDKTVDKVVKGETGNEPGLWDADELLSADAIDSIFHAKGDGLPAYRMGQGSIYLDDLGQVEDTLEGGLKDLVVNARNSYGFRSLALIPIELDTRITGFIQLGNKKAGGIPADMVEAVENTADQLKIVLDRLGLKDEVRRQRESLLRQIYERSAHLEALSERLKQEISERKKAQEEMRLQRDLATELSGIDNMDAAVHLCLDNAVRVSGADSGGIYIVDRQTGGLTLMCSKGLSDEFVKCVSHYDATSPNAQLVMGMKPIYSNVNDLEPALDDPYKMEGLKGAGIIPILHNDTAIGCLNVASHVYDEIPLNLRVSLETVSEQIGSVIARIQDKLALEDSEERYRTLFARTASPILVIDDGGNYIDGNDAALAFLECTREELLAMNVRDTLPPYLNEQWFDSLRSVWETGGTIERDYYVWGKIKVMEVTITPLQLGGRRIVFGIGKDITERKKVETALRESEEKYRQHFNNVSDVIYSLDCDLKITDVSQSVERLLGYWPQDLIGRQFEELNVLAPESVPLAYENMRSILAGKRVESSKYQFIAKDGTRKYGEVSGAPLLHDDKIVGIISVARDVSERQRAEEALRAGEEMFKNIVEHSSDLFFMQDSRRGIKYISPQIEAISGYSREEMSSRWRDFMTDNPVNAEGQKYVDAALLTGEKQPTYRYEFFKKDGSTILFEINETPVKDQNGDVVGFVGVARDITEHNKIEKALIESESRYRSLVESGGEGIATVDMAGQITFANDALCKMTGYAKEEVLMKQFVGFVHPEDRENTVKLFAEAVEGKRSTDYVQFRIVRKDGRVAWFYTHPTEMIVNGQAAGFTAILQDITERINTEEALRESEEKFRSVIENANEGILVVQDGQFKYANDRLIGFSQYSREEARHIAERPLADLLYPDDREMVLQNYLKRQCGEQAPMQYEFRWVDKDGSIRWADVRVNSFLWENKPAALCFIMDITDRKLSERAPVDSEERYRLLAENAVDVIFTADMKGEITYISPSVRYLVGRSAEELMNMYGRRTLTADVVGISMEDGERFRTGLQTVINDASRTQVLEYELKHRDGFTSWVEVKISTMRDKNGQAAGILGIVRDITQQKKMTERLVSADRLASLGEMAAGLAHEVNNPLTAVMGFAYLLQQNPNTPPEIKNDVEAIYREGKRAAEVIKSFLIFARGQKPEKQAVYINDILEGVLRLRRSQMNKENIEVESNLTDDLPAVQGDISQLQQAFLNIILNAEYFMYKTHRNGHLSLTTALEDGKIKIAIEDDGPGIPADKLNRVFDPFYTTKDVGEGIGLGLSICHGIIRGHGGDIYVESGSGRGATFIVELPAGR